MAGAASVVSLLYDLLKSPQKPNNALDIKKSRDNYYRVLRQQASQLDLTVIDDTFTQSSERVTLPKVYQDQYVREFSNESQRLPRWMMLHKKKLNLFFY